VNRRSALAAVAATALALCACASREILVPKSTAVPPGVDLTGRWRLLDESGLEQLEHAEKQAAGGIPLSPKSAKSASRPRRSKASLVHIFLETGSTLKITQTEHGLFISFDRAVVEEYRYGENRVVNVGPVEADRVSGWENGAYGIETLDEKGNKLIEHYALTEAGTILERRIRILRKGKPELSIVQRYERA
jgi:hypothetical protein